MFVKIERKKHSTLYQCEVASFHPFEQEDTSPQVDRKTITLVLEGMKVTKMVTLELDKESTCVYFLNDEGKTIDVYRW